MAVSNYEPGGVRVFDAETLELVADIPATYGATMARQVEGHRPGGRPGNRFVFSLWDAGEIWIADMSDPAQPGDHHASREIGVNPMTH